MSARTPLHTEVILSGLNLMMCHGVLAARRESVCSRVRVMLSVATQQREQVVTV
jgi:hypothetical protein